MLECDFGEKNNFFQFNHWKIIKIKLVNGKETLNNLIRYLTGLIISQ